MAQQIQNALAILRLNQVKHRTGLSRSTIYQAMKRGEFPRKVSLGARAVGWLDSEIEAFLRSRVEASRTEPLAR